MTEARDHFPELDGLDVSALHLRRDEIIRSANGNYKDLSDDSLSELLQITRNLRKKAAAPGSGKSGGRTKKSSATIDDLA